MTGSIRSKIKAPASLKREIARLHRTGKKVVFTNGCFDILHRGHVSYLEAAKKKGDRLVVALNSDESVRAIKGPTRPVNALADRLEVIAALGSVDYVTWFGEETPESLIRALHPDILVKGGDWKPAQIVGSRDVLGWGGRVYSLPFVAGFSTTRLIAKAAASGSR